MPFLLFSRNSVQAQSWNKCKLYKKVGFFRKTAEKPCLYSAHSCICVEKYIEKFTPLPESNGVKTVIIL